MPGGLIIASAVTRVALSGGSIMNKHTIRLELSFGARSLRVLLTAAMVFSVATEVASESVSLTTYYPAPSGVYTQLIGTSNTYLARDAGYLDVGTNVAPSAGTKMAVMNGNVGIGMTNPLWPLSVAGAGSFVSPHVGSTGGVIIRDAPGDPNAAYLQFTNNAEALELGHIQGLQGGGLSMMGGNVGIGTNAPASALSVNGGVQLGDDTSACTVAKSGTERWHSGFNQICNGTAWVSVSGSPVYVTATATAPGSAAAQANCPAGTTIIGGGVNCSTVAAAPVVLTSGPNGTSSWYAWCTNFSNAVWLTAYSVTATTWAICQ